MVKPSCDESGKASRSASLTASISRHHSSDLSHSFGLNRSSSSSMFSEREAFESTPNEKAPRRSIHAWYDPPNQSNPPGGVSLPPSAISPVSSTTCFPSFENKNWCPSTTKGQSDESERVIADQHRADSLMRLNQPAKTSTVSFRDGFHPPSTTQLNMLRQGFPGPEVTPRQRQAELYPYSSKSTIESTSSSHARGLSAPGSVGHVPHVSYAPTLEHSFDKQASFPTAPAKSTQDVAAWRSSWPGQQRKTVLQPQNSMSNAYSSDEDSEILGLTPQPPRIGLSSEQAKSRGLSQSDDSENSGNHRKSHSEVLGLDNRQRLLSQIISHPADNSVQSSRQGLPVDLFYHQFTPDIALQLHQEFRVGGGREDQHYIRQAAEHAWPIASILADAHEIFRPSQANNITLETFKENIVAKILVAHLKAGGPVKDNALMGNKAKPWTGAYTDQTRELPEQYPNPVFNDDILQRELAFDIIGNDIPFNDLLLGFPFGNLCHAAGSEVVSGVIRLSNVSFNI